MNYRDTITIGVVAGNTATQVEAKRLNHVGYVLVLDFKLSNHYKVLSEI